MVGRRMSRETMQLAYFDDDGDDDIGARKYFSMKLKLCIPHFWSLLSHVERLVSP